MDPLLPRKMTLDLIHNTSVDRSMGPYPVSLSHIAIEAVGKSQVLVGNKLHRFTGLISSACNQYVQYLLTGTNHSVLNRKRLGLQPWRCWLSTSHSLPFPTDSPPLFPNGPAWSQVINLNINLEQLKLKHLATEWPPCRSISTEPYHYA
jgi:hypothetical protein